jgi:predicted  nucleic acid-binding Zn-ribbon protein
MQELIENLVKLQAVELERTRVTQAARALPAEIAQAKATLAAAEGKAAKISAALSSEETLRTRLDLEVAASRKKAARLRTQQDSLTTTEQANAAENELHFADAEIERLEGEGIVSLERTEAQEAALAAARAQVESLTVALGHTRTRIARHQADFDRELAELAVQREALRPLIEPDVLIRFDRLCGSRGTGLARVDNQQCVGCRMGVRPQMWNQLREGELLVCDSCSRYIYWDPSMAPVPTPDAPKPKSKSKRKAPKPAEEE